MDVIDPSQILPITIIGCGSSGSAIGMVYAKMGGQMITLYDADMIESHNIPNQWYSQRYIGRNKAEVLDEVLRDITPSDMQPNIFTNTRHYQEGDMVSGITILCVDSIETRKSIFEEFRKSFKGDWLLDTRMASQFYEIYTIKMDNQKNVEEYAESLDLEMDEAPCTNRSVIYTPMLMASRVVWMIKRISRNEPVFNHYMEDLSNILFGTIKDWREGEEPQPRRV